MKKIVFVLLIFISSSVIADELDYCNVEDYEISKYIIENDIANIKFGDEIAGYYTTREEYINVYDSAITSQD
ncbi:MAG: hypothetical protein KZQ83_02045 [gamma proteobacterium symbiont of Taylorina sp.]|nr:hypothetical protein [gamma proteobacterium symbiont of Taylorina sp.]